METLQIEVDDASLLTPVSKDSSQSSEFDNPNILVDEEENQEGFYDLPLNSPSASVSTFDEHKQEKEEEVVGNENDHPDLTDAFTTDRIFESRAELLEWAKQRGREVGMVIIIKKSDLSHSGRTPRTSLACERQGVYKPKIKKKDGQNVVMFDTKYAKATKRNNCPFSLKGIHCPGSKDSWMVQVECGRHNHALSTYGGHSYVGRLTSEERNLVYEMTKAGVKPKNALSILKERDPSNASTLQNLYNVRKKMRVEEKVEKTHLQQLMLLIDQHGYIQHNRRDSETDVVKNLFWAHPDSIRMAKCFPYVFIMDSTYKSNKYKWPLFEIVGVSSTMMTFSVCYCLMEHETEVAYSWCLERFQELLNGVSPKLFVTGKEPALVNSLDNLFPEANKILCRWHVSMGVKAKGRSDLQDEEQRKKLEEMWHDVIHSTTVDEFESRLAEMFSYFNSFPSVIKYLKEAWLPYKERFVVAWTEQLLHFGNTSTKRAEGAHARLKRYLMNTSHYDFLSMWNMIHSSLGVQMTEIMSSFEKSINAIGSEYKIPFLADIRGSVSSSAMKFLAEEKNRCGEVGIDVMKCGCALKRTHGLPCAHEMNEIFLKDENLCLDRIHAFWKKLTLIPTRVYHSDLDLHEEYTIFVQRYERSTADERKYLLKQLKELAYQLEGMTPF